MWISNDAFSFWATCFCLSLHIETCFCLWLFIVSFHLGFLDAHIKKVLTAGGCNFLATFSQTTKVKCSTCKHSGGRRTPSENKKSDIIKATFKLHVEVAIISSFDSVSQKCELMESDFFSNEIWDIFKCPKSDSFDLWQCNCCQNNQFVCFFLCTCGYCLSSSFSSVIIQPITVQEKYTQKDVNGEMRKFQICWAFINNLMCKTGNKMRNNSVVVICIILIM